MKKKNVLIWCAATLLCASCQNSETRETPLTETLVTYVQEAPLTETLATDIHEKGKPHLLIGVKDTKNKKVIVPPDEYTDIKADENFITLKDGKNRTVVYFKNGQKLGIYEFFNHWTDNGNYYLGTNYNLSSFYFPDTNSQYLATAVYPCSNAILLELQHYWLLVDYNGKELLHTSPKIWILNNAKQAHQEDILIVFKTGKEKAPYSAFNSQGKLVKNLTQREFNKMQSSFTNTKKLGMESLYAEV